jgi:hypothetical protein
MGWFGFIMAAIEEVGGPTLRAKHMPKSGVKNQLASAM